MPSRALQVAGSSAGAHEPLPRRTRHQCGPALTRDGTASTSGVCGSRGEWRARDRCGALATGAEEGPPSLLLARAQGMQRCGEGEAWRAPQGGRRRRRRREEEGEEQDQRRLRKALREAR